MNKIKVKPRSSRENLMDLLFDGNAKLSRALENSLEKRIVLDVLPTTSVREKYTKVDQISNRDREKEEVYKLQDKLVPYPRPRSKFVARYKESRRLKYGTIMNQLLADLDYFGDETKEGLKFVSKHLTTNLDTNHAEIDEILNSLKNLETEGDVKDIWTSVDMKYQENDIWIREFSATLVKQENLKLLTIQDMFRKSYVKLCVVGYFSSAEVNEHLIEIAMDVQKANLRNHKTFSQLRCNLSLQEGKQKLQHYLLWKEFFQSWLEKVSAAALHQYKLILPAIADGSYPPFNDVIKKFVINNEHLTTKRLEQLYKIRDFKPPLCNKDSLEKFTLSLSVLNKEHEILCDNFGERITMKDTLLIEQLGKEIWNIKQSLITRGICCPETAEQVLGNEHVQLMEDHILDLNLLMENIKREKNYQRDGFEALENAVVLAIEELIEIWETHKANLSGTAKILESKLDAVQQEVHEMNEVLESKISILVEQMRQAKTNEKLEELFSHIVLALEDIENFYITFHDKRLQLVNTIPGLVWSEVNQYRIMLQNFFGPTAGHLLNPLPSTRRPNTVIGFHTQTVLTDTATPQNDVSIKPDGKENEKFKNSSAGKAVDRPKTFGEWKNIDLIQYVLHYHPTGSCSQESFSQPSRPVYRTTSALQFDKFPASEIEWIGYETRLQHLLRIVCVNFSAHFEHWLLERIRDVSNLKEIKTIELEKELDLRMHIHSTRLERIKRDIYEVRDAKLRNQSKQVESHVSNITKELDIIKFKLAKFVDQQHIQMKDLKKQVETMEESMKLLFSSIVNYQAKMVETVNEYVKKEKNVIASFRETCSKSIASFHEANVNLIASLSGNESSAVIDELDKLFPLLQAVESDAMQTLAHLDTSWTAEGDSLLTHIGTRWEFADVDMEFAEQINRWFTNTQVKIKSEVKANNAQSSQVQSKIDHLNSALVKAMASTSDEILNDLESYLQVYSGLIKDCISRGIQLGILNPLEFVIEDSEMLLADNGKLQKIPATTARVKKMQSAINYCRIPPELQVFGDQADKGPELRAVIRVLLYKVQNEIIRVSENYYLKKAERPIRFPSMIPSTFDQCCVDITAKLKNYWLQTKEYIRESSAEFYAQVEQMDTLFPKLVQLVFDMIQVSSKIILRKKLSTYQSEIANILTSWSNSSNSLTRRLRPQLGYPSATMELSCLMNEVKNEVESQIGKLSQIYDNSQEVIMQCATEFIRELSQRTEFLLKQTDQQLTVEDVQHAPKGSFDSLKTLHPRTPRVAGSQSITRQQGVELKPGLKNYSWLVGDGLSIPENFIAKSTPVHECVVQSRDAGYHAFGKDINEMLSQLHNERDYHVDQINQWYVNWLTSIGDLKRAVDMH